MTRLLIARVFGCALMLFAMACDRPATRFPEANLILISIDTLRADHLGTYGYARPTSPFIDRLASESIVFERAIAQSTWTMPSHASLFTSRYPSEMGLGYFPDPGRIPDRFPMLAQVLRRSGFRTRAVTDGGFVRKRWGFGRGFESYREHGDHFRKNMQPALDQLAKLANERFFFFLHTYDVHAYERDTPFAEKFLRPYTGPLRAEQRLVENIQQGFNEEWVAKLEPADLDYLIDLYDAEIRYVDAELERLAAVLKRLGVWERSVLVITSDHGEEFLEHGRTGHGFTQFDEQVHVPLIVRLPGAAHAGTRITSQVRLIDVMPTVLDLLGVDAAPEGMRGESLVPLLADDDAARPAYTDPGHRGEVSVRTPEWKVIYRHGMSNWSAFDLSADPGEQDPILGNDLPPEPQRLLEELQTWRATMAADATRSDATPLTEAETEELRALGYVE